VAELGTRHALSDVDAARLLLAAGIEAALLNVDVNAALISDPDVAQDFARRAADLRHQTSKAAKAVWQALLSRKPA
jgi:formiminotetrahydrofolate cyclodeaminase